MGVVSFDLDGTLWEFGPMMDGALASAIASLEHHHPELAGRLSVDELHRHRDLVASQMQGTLAELRLISMRRALAAVGRDEPELAVWLSDELLQARADVVGVHSDVEPVVDELLGRGHLVGAITNGNFPLHRLELARRFSFIVHAEEVGELKPAGAPFARAVELIGHGPERFVHVGDEIETDVLGAQAYGMRAVWLNRGGDPTPPEVHPDAVISSLEPLPDLVDRLLDG
ncbi:MAG: hydrolase / 5-amino-6-(5-phospho-D-ribitylamino)uracil phosphatase [Gaiellales bacterium]|jgi:putative hydrolase of the HAD superfamily|nr:hydrolase / 5-amino-6-(5-phospho-D-ribitylamino)uracil phosphatase [Gaiellales bacterium]